VRFWLASAVGLAIPIALCIWWFSARGALDDWIAVHVQWIPSSYTQVDAAWLNRAQYLLAFLTTEQFAPAIPLVVAGLYVVRQQSGRDVLMLVSWVLMAVLGVLIQGSFYAYHWLPVYPPLALLAGIGLDGLWTWVTGSVPPATRPELTAERMVRDTSIASVVGVALSAVVLAGAITEPFLHVYRYAKSAATGNLSYDRVEFGPFGRGGVFPEPSFTCKRERRRATRCSSGERRRRQLSE
jgi:hypothetical protein